MQQFSMRYRDYSGKGRVQEVAVSFLNVGLRLQINLKRDYEYLKELMSILKLPVSLNCPKAS